MKAVVTTWVAHSVSGGGPRGGTAAHHFSDLVGDAERPACVVGRVVG